MRRLTRMVLYGLAAVGLAAGLRIGVELVDAPLRWMSAQDYTRLAGLHRWALMALVAAIPTVVAARWGGSLSPASRALGLAGIPLGTLLIATLPHNPALWGQAVVLTCFAAATLAAASRTREPARRGAVVWAGATLVAAGGMHGAAAAGIDVAMRWPELSQGWVLRGVCVGLPFAALLRHLDISTRTKRFLAAGLVLFTLCGGPLQPLRVVCAALALKTLRQAAQGRPRRVARSWLLGAAGFVVVSECAAAVIGLNHPAVAYTYVPVAQTHYIAASGFAAIVASWHLTHNASRPRRGERLWAVTFILGVHAGCGALVLLGRAGMPRLYPTYVSSLEPLFHLALLGSALALVGGARMAWTWRRVAPPVVDPSAVSRE